MLRNNRDQITVAFPAGTWDKLEAIATERMKATGKATNPTQLIREAVERLIEEEGEVR
jgi:hypothetical protein